MLKRKLVRIYDSLVVFSRETSISGITLIMGLLVFVGGWRERWFRKGKASSIPLMPQILVPLMLALLGWPKL